MLVLQRSVDERIVFVVDGKVIATLKVCEIRNHAVKLGTDAGPEVGIFREEVWKKMQ